MVDGERRHAPLDPHDVSQWHLDAAAGRHMEAHHVFELALTVCVDLQHDPVLVAHGVDGRDLSLREGIGQRLVDRTNGDAQTGSGHAVDDDARFEPAPVTVTRHVDEFGQFC